MLLCSSFSAILCAARDCLYQRAPTNRTTNSANVGVVVHVNMFECGSIVANQIATESGGARQSLTSWTRSTEKLVSFG